MDFFGSKKRARHVSKADGVVKCKKCHVDKPVLFDCAWDASHLVCDDCAMSCDRCGKKYCDDCRIVLVFCDACDAPFCPDCKPWVCRCIVPRAATCFMIKFKKKTYADIMEEKGKKKAKRQISDDTAKSSATVTTATKESSSSENA